MVFFFLSEDTVTLSKAYGICEGCRGRKRLALVVVVVASVVSFLVTHLWTTSLLAINEGLYLGLLGRCRLFGLVKEKVGCVEGGD